jgi:thiamine-monophosphate kinase
LTAQRDSEFDLIQFIRRSVGPLRPGVAGVIGDDCAVFEGPFARRFVVTTDMMIEGEHFRRDWISPTFLGRKVCRVNLSDLAAMGAKPFACLLNLGLPAECLGSYFENLIRGFLGEAEAVSMSLIGGDLSRSDRLFLAVTAIGYVDSGEPVLRSGARPDDRLMLIGRLGLARRGLDILGSEAPSDFDRIESEDSLRALVDSEETEAALRAHCLPEAHVEPAVWLQERALAHAMIDVSDGLAADVLHLLEESGLSGKIDEEELRSASGAPHLPLDFLLNGGEDYALVFTCSAEQLARIRREYPKAWPPPHAIGRVIAGEPQLFLCRGGKSSPCRPAGFDHFR